jgi:hypothetical protein
LLQPHFFCFSFLSFFNFFKKTFFEGRGGGGGKSVSEWKNVKKLVLN